MMASEQAASIVEAETVVIPTKSIPQGISALFQYDLESSLEDNKRHMSDALKLFNLVQLLLQLEILK